MRPDLNEAVRNLNSSIISNGEDRSRHIVWNHSPNAWTTNTDNKEAIALRIAEMLINDRVIVNPTPDKIIKLQKRIIEII